MSPRRLALAAAVALGVLVGAVLAAAGSSTTVLVTRGASMQPAFAAGDLALLRPTPDYEVGDVAGYRSQALNRVVLHRIVAVDGDVLTFQGDANSFRDPEAVAAQDVVGEVVLRVPVAGAVLLWLTSPVNTLLLTAVVGLAVVLSRRARGNAPAPDLDSDRVVAIDDLVLPRDLPTSDVAELANLLRLAERHDRPVLHDAERGLLFVVEDTMLFRHLLRTAPEPVARLALVQSSPGPARGTGRRRSLRGPGWDYSRTGS